MRIYIKEQACGFRFTKAAWGQPSATSSPLRRGRSWPVPGPLGFPKACLPGLPNSPAHPDVQQRIAKAPTAKEAAAIGRAPGLGIDPGWNAQRVDVMRWVLRMKREANAAEIDTLLAETGERPIVEVSTRDPWWGARPVGDRYEGHNVLGRLWMELRHHLREDDPAARSGAWTGRIRVGRLADGAPRAHAAPESA